MKLTNTLLAIALPLALSAGCAMDVGSSSDGLTVNANNDFGSVGCTQTTAQWLGDSRWPVAEIVAGDMVFTQDELNDYVTANPGGRADLIGEIAAAQLNIAVGAVPSAGVLNQLSAAEDLVLAPIDNPVTPPVVSLDGFGNLVDFNSRVNLDCFAAAGQAVLDVDKSVDTRENLTQLPPATARDLRDNLLTEQ